MYSKRGQFYLLAAIIIISVIMGFVTIKNFTKSKGEIRIYDLGDELGIEGGEVLDHGTYRDYDPSEFQTLLENFTRVYSEYAGQGRDLYFVFGNSNEIIVATYAEIATGSISVDIGGATTIFAITQNEYRKNTITDLTDEKIVVNINEVPYEFNLKRGENFYFVITQEIAGERYIDSNKQ